MKALFEAATRHRLPFLVVSLVVALLLVTGMTVAGGVLGGVLFAAALVLYLVLVSVAVAAMSHHPRRLIERPGELATVDGPAPVLIAAGVTLLVTGLVADNVADWRELTPFELALTFASPLLLALSWYTALGSFGVRLRSDGIHERRPFATLFVPWDALDPDLPAEPSRLNTVTLQIRHPESVVRRGLPGNTGTLRSTTEAAYLAGVINSAVNARTARR